MLTVITGQPGAGKTLYTLKLVKEWAEKENRTVHYSGIKDLKLPWIEMDDSTQWYKLPPGSIVVIDEAQRIFRQRGVGSQVPPHVAELETHRHKGFDIVLITQHPKLLDANVRRLVGRHYHVMRTFGMQRATIHEFTELQSDPDSPSGRSESIRHEWGYDKALFAAYHSAEVHTHKRRIPARVLMLFGIPFVLAVLGYFAWDIIGGWVAKPLVVRSLEKQGVGVSASASGQKAASGASAPKSLTSGEYIAQRTARIEGLPYTAPAYDSVTSPTFAPYPAVCIASASKCRCYTDQSTRLDTPVALCRAIAEKGYFIEWEPKQRTTPPLPAEPHFSGDHRAEKSSAVSASRRPSEAVPVLSGDAPAAEGGRARP